MSKEDSTALIRQPVAGQVSFDDAAVDELWRYTHGHPYLLQYLCKELIDEMNRRGEGNYIAIGHVNKAIEKLLAEQNMHLNNLWDDCSKNEKAILFVLAESDELMKKGVTQFGLGEKLADLNENDITNTLTKLVKRELVESLNPYERGATPVFVHKILLFSRWIYRNKTAE